LEIVATITFAIINSILSMKHVSFFLPNYMNRFFVAMFEAIILKQGILKIGQYLVKLRTSVSWHIF